MPDNEIEIKGFFLHISQCDAILRLPDAQIAGVIRACRAYCVGEEPDLTDAMVGCVFELMRPVLDKAKTRAIAGQKGGEAKASNAKQTLANASKGLANSSKLQQTLPNKNKKLELNNNTPIGVFVAADGDDDLESAAESKVESLPPCPHRDIVALYHEILPELPRVKVWQGARKSHLQARWRESLARQHIRDKSGGIDYWRRYFGYVRKCPLLMGQVTQRDGRAWRADLPWLVKAENYAKVIEGRYIPGGEQ